MRDNAPPDTVPSVGVWLFGTNLPRAQLDALLDPDGDPAVLHFGQFRIPDVVDEREPLAVLLGTNWVDHDFVEVIDLNDLGGMSLNEYLVDAVGIHTEQVAAIDDVLSALKCPVIAVFEQALAGQTACVHPDLRLIPLGFYTDLPGPVVYTTERVPGAKPRKRTAGYGALLAPMLVLAIVAWVYWGR